MICIDIGKTLFWIINRTILVIIYGTMAPDKYQKSVSVAYLLSAFHLIQISCIVVNVQK